MAMAMSILTLVIAIVAGGAVLVVVVLIIITSLLWRRHKRQLADAERQILSSRLAYAPEYSNITRPPVALQKTAPLNGNSDGKWEVLSSNEDLLDTRRHARKKRKERRKSSDLLRWSRAGSSPSRRWPMERIKVLRLSTVIESPKIDVFPQPIEECDSMSATEHNLASETLDSPQLPTPSFQRFESPGEMSPSEALRPAPLRFSKRASDMFAPNTERRITDRSISVPEILIQPDDEVFGGIRSSSAIHNRRSRSNSLGQASAAPSAPLPPLPNMTPNRRVMTVRSVSSESIITTGSNNSSVLFRVVPSPIMVSRNEFSERHPEMGLSPRVREEDTGLRDALLAGPRQAQVASRIRDSPRLVSSRGSLLVHSEKQEDRESSLRESLHDNRPESRITEKMQSEKRSSVLAPDSNGTASMINVLSSPKNRDSLIRKVSDSFGSPIERPKRRSSALRRISGNSTMPPRENSEASMKSNDSCSTSSNPFIWDTRTPPVSYSALKGSPNTRKTAHRRSKCVQFSMIPIVQPISRTSSWSKNLDTVNETADDASTLSSRPFDAVIPPKSSVFNPQLSLTKYRASLNEDSVTLALNEYQIPQNSRKLEQKSGEPSNKAADHRQSTASSILSIPVFPQHVSPSTTNQVTPNSEEFEDVPVNSSERSRNSPPKRYIPGLTLLQQKYDLDSACRNKNSNHTHDQELMDLQSNTPPLTPTQSLAAQLTIAATMPARFSPAPNQSKLSPNLSTPSLNPSPDSRISMSTSTSTSTRTQISRTSTSIKPSDRPKTLTNNIPPQNPMRSKPDFTPAPPVPQLHPSGPRASPTSSLLKSIKTLRRDNSEAFHSNSDASKKYLNPGSSIPRHGHRRSPASSSLELADLRLSCSSSFIMPDGDQDRKRDREKEEDQKEDNKEEKDGDEDEGSVGTYTEAGADIDIEITGQLEEKENAPPGSSRGQWNRNGNSEFTLFTRGQERKFGYDYEEGGKRRLSMKGRGDVGGSVIDMDDLDDMKENRSADGKTIVEVTPQRNTPPRLAGRKNNKSVAWAGVNYSSTPPVYSSSSSATPESLYDRHGVLIE